MPIRKSLMAAEDALESALHPVAAFLVGALKVVAALAVVGVAGWGLVSLVRLAWNHPLF